MAQEPKPPIDKGNAVDELVTWVLGIIIFSVTAAWLYGFILIVQEAMRNAQFRDEIEGMGLLLLITGRIVEMMLEKFFARWGRRR